jgi:hypothetical protein
VEGFRQRLRASDSIQLYTIQRGATYSNELALAASCNLAGPTASIIPWIATDLVFATPYILSALISHLARGFETIPLIGKDEFGVMRRVWGIMEAR